MHDHDNNAAEHLGSYADILAGELPGTWRSAHHRHETYLSDIADRVWDLDLIADALAEHPLRQAVVLSRPDGAQLVVLDRHDDRAGFLVAALALPSLPDEAYRDVPEPNGIALADDPFLSAEQVAGDLLARYDTALAQVRHNAAACIPASQPDRVVMAWQPDGSLATVPVGDVAAAVLVASGFVHDPHTGIHRLSGDDTQAQARTVRKAGRRLGEHGIATALQHPSGRIAPAATPATTPAPANTPTSASRAR
ncbi:hypothetical protein V1460_30455 [Streptomyces sp. SCSIO 30461]|uniref:hypothetical protein n=1 Tax=Streptomyces sp. SCSIO 30461 TaxID=3118085 RepID=UPI0030CFE923